MATVLVAQCANNDRLCGEREADTKVRCRCLHHRGRMSGAEYRPDGDAEGNFTYKQSRL
jgi:hypothetical protein